MAGDRALAPRIQALTEAVRLSVGRADDHVVADATGVLKRAGERLAIAGEHTVVALAGATGSGKSSAFNAITGSSLARTGVTRPTTSEAMGVAWGTELPTVLLDWLGVPRRHLIASTDSAFEKLVLLDLPDHDSTETAHRLTVDAMVKVVDMLVWIVDPQKYADAALHDGYLKPLAAHSDIMVVVLNQSDRLTPDQLARAAADLRRLLDSEGLERTPVLAMSALTGQGVGELRQLLARTVATRAMTTKRFSADVTQRARALADELGIGKVPTLDAATLARLEEATAEASGVPLVVDGVRKAWQHRGTLATGWPMVTWLKRLKPDPLRRLRVGMGARELSPTDVSRTSLPKADPVQRARLDAALRGVVDAATQGVPRGWADEIRRAARGNERVLADQLDTAIAGADLRLDRGRGWWVLITILQWLLVVAAVAGAVWLGLPLLFAYLQIPDPLPIIVWSGWPLQTLLLVGGLAAGVVLALLSRVLVELGAQAKAARARGILTDAVGDVVAREVVAPVRAELDRLIAARAAVQRAL